MDCGNLSLTLRKYRNSNAVIVATVSCEFSVVGKELEVGIGACVSQRCVRYSTCILQVLSNEIRISAKPVLDPGRLVWRMRCDVHL